MISCQSSHIVFCNKSRQNNEFQKIQLIVDQILVQLRNLQMHTRSEDYEHFNQVNFTKPPYHRAKGPAKAFSRPMAPLFGGFLQIYIPVSSLSVLRVISVQHFPRCVD